MASDYYQTLGLDRSASADDIKRAYRRMAHQYHPDKQGGNEEKFKQINEAYQVLGDEQKKSQYDQFGATFDQGSGAQGGGGFENVDMGGFADIFSDFFGGGTRTRRQHVRRGADIAMDITLDFLSTAHGQQHISTQRIYQVCSHCHGNAAEPGTPIRDCATCGGKGQVTTTRQTMLGVFAQTSVCPECGGDGKRVETPCRTCRGTGRERVNRTLTIDIPAGIADGQTIRISGKGEAPARGGLAGDLYVNIHVHPHPTLTRDGDDVRSAASISFIDAALGTKIKVPTLQGETKLTIPAGTQPSHEITLDDKGFPRLHQAGKGNHIITIKVEIPKKLSRQQKELLESWRSTPKKGLFF